MIHSKLDEDNEIVVHDVLRPCRPTTDTSTTTRLVGVSPARVKFAISILDSIYVLICKLCTPMIEALGVRKHFLKPRRVDFIAVENDQLISAYSISN